MGKRMAGLATDEPEQQLVIHLGHEVEPAIVSRVTGFKSGQFT
jgi:hypothetical protein